MKIYKSTIQIIGWIAIMTCIFSFIHQAYKVYYTNETKALALSMWILGNIACFLWIIYGALIGSPPLMYGNIIMLILGSYIMIKKIMNSKKNR